MTIFYQLDTISHTVWSHRPWIIWMRPQVPNSAWTGRKSRCPVIGGVNIHGQKILVGKEPSFGGYSWMVFVHFFNSGRTHQPAPHIPMQSHLAHTKRREWACFNISMCKLWSTYIVPQWHPVSNSLHLQSVQKLLAAHRHTNKTEQTQWNDFWTACVHVSPSLVHVLRHERGYGTYIFLVVLSHLVRKTGLSAWMSS